MSLIYAWDGQRMRFNPLAGIRCFLTPVKGAGDVAVKRGPSFNPLAGIRCFLTSAHQRSGNGGRVCFNPLAGIRCFLTMLDGEYADEVADVSIP